MGGGRLSPGNNQQGVLDEKAQAVAMAQTNNGGSQSPFDLSAFSSGGNTPGELGPRCPPASGQRQARRPQAPVCLQAAPRGPEQAPQPALFPTTTIGSFPQTKEIRSYRARFNKGEITQEEYEKFLEDEIKFVVEKQEALDLDVLVHGEPERNDMVQYFGELLDGFAFTQNAWVQSFARVTVCLRAPSRFSTGRSPRADISKEIQAKQIALALRDEVNDLEKAGIRSIQEDEPALREGLPLREAEHKAYLDWAVAAFRLSTSGVRDETQIVSHFCYSDFANRQIMQSILDLDADMISIENSKSDAKILKVFQNFEYANDIGPGVFDIHSPRVPTSEEMFNRLKAFSAYLPVERLWCNPDCGLKTRSWDEAAAQCKNMVEAAKRARSELAK
ncbi:hypothetical protein L7F22_030715 [Adiantum nelumboides]|nr:hypothetical protein [Adiantum nelumboides]